MPSFRPNYATIPNSKRRKQGCPVRDIASGALLGGDRTACRVPLSRHHIGSPPTGASSRRQLTAKQLLLRRRIIGYPIERGRTGGRRQQTKQDLRRSIGSSDHEAD